MSAANQFEYTARWEIIGGNDEPQQIIKLTQRRIDPRPGSTDAVSIRIYGTKHARLLLDKLRETIEEVEHAMLQVTEGGT